MRPKPAARPRGQPRSKGEHVMSVPHFSPVQQANRRERVQRPRTSRLACLMVLSAALLGCVLPQAASAEEPAATSEAVSSNKGLGPAASVPSWAVGKRVHFMAGQPASSGLAGEPLEGSGELGRRPGTDKPLLYHGSGSGAQHSPVLYPIFWGKNWEVEPGLALKKQLTKLYEGLSTSTWQGILTQYFDSTGRVSSTVTVATPWIDTSVTHPTSVNNAKLKEEVATALKAEANKSWKREFSSQFVVMPAPGSTYEAGFDTGFCAYHGVDGSGSSYTFLPYLGEEPFKSGCVKFYEPKHENADNVDSMAASHEFSESATDAGLNSWYTKEGWEIGDLCASEGAAEEVTSGSLKGSWVQGIWDDHQSACSLADEEPPHVYAVTEAASEVKVTTGTLHGTVNPEALETKYHFEYGTTTSYGSSTSEVSAGSGVTNQAESAAITGLTGNTGYHYRLVAKNSTGTTDGEDYTFTTSTPPAWSVQTTLNPGANFSEFKGVSCTSYNACIAVGNDGYKNVPLAEKWDNTEWALLTIPTITAEFGELDGVSCSSAAACTAVGSEGYPRVPLAERWNGTEWSLQSIPAPKAEFTEVNAVSCSSSSACIAVGSDGYPRVPMAESWNGTAWSLQSIPAPKATEKGGEFSELEGVSCSSSTSCTAVGLYGYPITIFAERWNGAEWSIQSMANPTGALESYGDGVSCTSATTCTAVGGYENSSKTQVTLAEYWNGTEWKLQTTPNPTGAIESHLNGCHARRRSPAAPWVLPRTAREPVSRWRSIGMARNGKFRRLPIRPARQRRH